MQQGIVLLIVGMATVFAFLVLLVIAMQLSARFFTAFAHLFPEETSTGTSAPAAADETTRIAIALAAIRAKRG
jgi:sodium pump decarboxylase gamma subunit